MKYMIMLEINIEIFSERNIKDRFRETPCRYYKDQVHSACDRPRHRGVRREPFDRPGGPRREADIEEKAGGPQEKAPDQAGADRRQLRRKWAPGGLYAKISGPGSSEAHEAQYG